jgi:hypothetical protein
MRVENESTPIESDFKEKWHASYLTVTSGVASLGSLIIAGLVHDLELKKSFACLAIYCGGAEAIFLFIDSLRPQVKKFMTGQK